MNSKERELLKALLGDEVSKRIINELGIGDAPLEDQLEVVTMIGKNIQDRVLLEILEQLPKEKLDEFYELFNGDDLGAVREFLRQYIPELDKFVQHYASLEYETTKTRTHQLTQGV